MKKSINIFMVIVCFYYVTIVNIFFKICTRDVHLNQPYYLITEKIKINSTDIIFNKNSKSEKIEFFNIYWGVKVVVAPKISLWKKKIFYDFKTGNHIISRIICKERHSFQ